MDELVDDIKELLDKERGDKRILEQILRACENNEVISNFERNYVQKLSEKHLGKKPPIEKKTPTPDVNLLEAKPIQEEKPLLQEPKPIKTTKPKNQALFIGIGVAALAIIIIAAVAFSELPDITTGVDTAQPNESIASTGPLSLQTDLSSYSRGDIISISGKSESSLGNQITLSIQNQNNQLAWSENVNVKSDGRFSTLLIAGGEGWEESGTYTLEAQHGTESEAITFSFRN